MKTLVINTALFLVMFGCTENQSENTKRTISKADTVIKNNFSNLLSKYKTIDKDTFKVYYEYSNSENKSAFYGAELDSSEVLLFPSEIKNLTSFYHCYACYKFLIDDNRTGLITRTPSYYESSSIKLLVYDKRVDSITYFIKLADEWGDAGDAFSKISWIYNINSKNNVFTQTIYTYDHSIDNENDTTIDIEKSYCILTLGEKFADTTKNISPQIIKHFK